ncbi:MAG: C-GCAxxG-C-C family protein [Chloroflexi bacterium]|nr:C-GCAxxG-C-C family protein [Chloroflexota bacterium]MCL5107469.1 C-GCAxxG-C-C family protein [Chloroflexota bacterium]MDA8219769.1 C-GCAxxG-C-C family protein [Dehalococcoidales bacterium]
MPENETTLSPASQEKARRAAALAYEFEQKYGSCPQCVLEAINQAVMPVSDDLFKASHALAGGGVLYGVGSCGALVGGILALGNRFGRDRAHFDKGRRLTSYQKAKRLYDRFVAEYGGPTCATVQTRTFGRSFNLWEKEDHDAFEAAGGHVDKCTRVAANVAQWAAEILLEDEERTQGRKP